MREHFGTITASRTRSRLWTLFGLKGTTRSVYMLAGLFPTVHAQEAVAACRENEPANSSLLKVKRVPVCDEDAMKFIERETGFQRLKNTMNGTFSEASGTRFTQDAVVGMAQVGAVVGFAVGWVIGVNKGAEEFSEKHRLTKFATQYRAVRMRTDAMMMSGLRHGAIWAFKISGFLALYSFTAESISVYRNSSSPLDYTAAGAITCGILRSHLGPRAAFVAALMGSVMGSVTGGGFWALSVASGTSRQTRHLQEVKAFLQAQADQRKQFELIDDLETKETC